MIVFNKIYKQENIMSISPVSARSLLSTLGFFLYFSGTLSASAAALSVSQKPLMLTESVPPNMLLTLDDSGSMRWAFAPDNKSGEGASRRAKSSAFNPMYYNPKVTYIAPKIFNTDGTEQQLSTSFSQALHNGYNSGRGNADLSSNYKVHWTYDPDGNAPTSYGYDNTNPRLAENPSSDFPTCYVTSLNNNETKTCTSSGETLSITRASSGRGCTVSASGRTNGVCSYNSSNGRYTGGWAQAGVPAYYYIYDASKKANCSIADDDCYTLRFVPSAEQQNFANWYSFYRNRALATISAAALAFYDLSPEVRLSWQSLKDCTSFTSTSTNSNCRNNAFKAYSTAHKGQLYSWLQRIPFSGGTPLPDAMIRAGNYYSEDRPWQKNPGGTGNTSDNTYACRPSYHIMMTDGIWGTAASSTPASFRHDNGTFTLKDGREYNGQHPYKDSQNNTLADLAMHYWATDLRPTLNDGLTPYMPHKSGNDTTNYWDPRNDPATWQHMVNFMMGLGLTEALDNPKIPWTGSTHAGPGYQALLNGEEWPKASTSGGNNNVYDLWHAALNSRGEFFSVDTPEAMVQAFTDILSRINDRTTTAARPAVSASFVSDNDGNNLQSNVYATQFSSEDWSGQLTKTLVNANGQTTELWNIQTANQSLDPLDRQVMMAASSNNSTGGLKDFTWANLGTLQSLLNIDPDSLVGAQDNRGEQRVAYIRGERSGEGDTTPKFRKRNNRTVMGDIINSSPAVVGTPAYLAYLADAIENPLGNRASYKSYAAFRETYQKSSVNNPDGRPEMIYVGGNDGMLHGFNAATGREEFAFIPTEVIKNLYRLTGQNYSGAGHRYFVDGSPIVRDVYFGDDEGWRTVLIGTLRAGGRALFALDVTDPTQIKLLWEFGTTQDSDLGFTFAQPEIVRLHTGQWAVLQGNGYDSTDDKAALLVIDIKSGDLIRKIPVPDTLENNVRLPNGLSSVRGADNNGDGLVDYAYAGDLQGNLWRFDLVKTTSDIKSITGDPFARTNTEVSSTTKDDFKLAYGGRPLFVARDKAGSRQAITIQPSLVRHPSGYGYLVLMGTGKYFEASDANVDTSRAMTLYGIWDRNTKRQATSSSTLRPEARAGLQEQQFTQQEDNESFKNAEGEVTATRDIRLLSDKLPKWYKDPESGQQIDTTRDENVNKWGWALDMAVVSSNGTPKLEGEMIINNMTASGSILFLSSLTPNQDPCQAGADTWLYAVDAFTGGRTRFNVLDLNADKVINQYDQYDAKVVSGMRFPALGGFTLAPGNKVFGSDGAADPATVGDDPNSSGRQSWHIVPEEFQ